MTPPPFGPLKWAEIDLDAIRHNARAVQGLVGAHVGVMAVVKANAYGHGAVAVARAALEAGARWLGVSSPEEALELRGAGVTAPLLNLAYTPEAAFAELIRQGVSLTVWEPGAVVSLAKAARAAGRAARVHVKVDTGMGRLGAEPAATIALAGAIAGDPQFVLEGLYTHLADADNPDPAYTERQLDRFEGACAAVTATLRTPLLVHAANSAALLRHPRARYHLVRPGILLYGAHPVPGWTDLDLRPAMTVKALITRVQEVPAGSRIGYGLAWTAPDRRIVATVAAGYADGMTRRLSNRGQVLLHGRRYPMVGRVSMDQLMVDVTGSRARVGEAVVLLGGDKDSALSVDEVAAVQGTISWEVWCGISARVPRHYTPPGGGGGSVGRRCDNG